VFFGPHERFGGGEEERAPLELVGLQRHRDERANREIEAAVAALPGVLQPNFGAFQRLPQRAIGRLGATEKLLDGTVRRFAHDVQFGVGCALVARITRRGQRQNQRGRGQERVQMIPDFARDGGQFVFGVDAFGQRDQRFQFDLMALARGDFARHDHDPPFVARADAAQGRLEPIEIAVAMLDTPDARARQSRRVFGDQRFFVAVGHAVKKRGAFERAGIVARRHAKRGRDIAETALGVQFADQIETRIGDGAVTLGARLRQRRSRVRQI